MRGQPSKERLGEGQCRSATAAVKRRDGRRRVRSKHSPTDQRSERLVKMHDIGREVLDGPSRVAPYHAFG